MSRVDFFRDLGLDVETAVILDDELSALPRRTRLVFMAKAGGYTDREIEGYGICPAGSVWLEMRQVSFLHGIVGKLSKNRAYIGEGEVVSDYS